MPINFGPFLFLNKYSSWQRYIWTGDKALTNIMFWLGIEARLGKYIFLALFLFYKNFFLILILFPDSADISLGIISPYPSAIADYIMINYCFYVLR